MKKNLESITDVDFTAIGLIIFDNAPNAVWEIRKHEKQLTGYWADCFLTVKHDGTIYAGEDHNTDVEPLSLLKAYDYLRSVGYDIPNAYANSEPTTVGVDWEKQQTELWEDVIAITDSNEPDEALPILKDNYTLHLKNHFKQRGGGENTGQYYNSTFTTPDGDKQ